ncbi:MAG: CxxC-x17-CxxC domain-containing protein [Candidatus Altiarchaeota archaeon]
MGEFGGKGFSRKGSSRKGSGRGDSGRGESRRISVRDDDSGGSGFMRKSPARRGSRPGFKSSERGGSRGFEGSSPTGFNGRPRRAMDVDVICDNCGKATTVPFKPTAGKPVYCINCYKTKDSSKESGKSGSYARELADINKKLDRIMKALEVD